MIHKTGDMFLKVDYRTHEGTIFRIASIDGEYYQIICHDGSWWIMDDISIHQNGFKKIWNLELDAMIKDFYQ